ncbi:MAG: GNAT family N-acetyltransferase [Bacteroidales bacterium]
MEIRRITEFNEIVYQAVLNLLPQLDPAYPLPSRDDFKHIISDKNTWFLICEKGSGEIAAMLTLVTYIIPTGRKFWIEDVVVDGQSRGQGLGRAIVERALDIAKKEGGKKADLTSRPFRTAANQLYRNMGFVPRETNFYRYEF